VLTSLARLFQHQFAIATPLKAEAIVERLRPLVLPARPGLFGAIEFAFTWDGTGKTKFAGTLGDSEFSLRRMPALWKTWRRQPGVFVHGRIVQAPSGSVVYCSAGVQAYELGIAAFITIAFLWSNKDARSLGEGLVLGLLPLVGWAIWLAARKFEAGQVEGALLLLLRDPPARFVTETQRH
jgi:hypothetical protein